MKNEIFYNYLLDMLDYNCDMYNLIEDMDLLPKSYNYWKRNNIIDVIGVLEYLSNFDNKVPAKIRKETIRKIYNEHKDDVLLAFNKLDAINKIEYYEKQIYTLKRKYGLF